MEKKIKGVILAGGKGTRLLPMTKITNKHLVGILNTPMIHFPIETLKSFGIKDILLISGGDHIGSFAEYLGNGSEFGINLTYKVQTEAGGIAQALGLAEDFVQGESFITILGDNIFEPLSFGEHTTLKDNAIIFLKEVEDPERFGVPVFAGVEGEDWSTLRIEKIEEKPKVPKSEYAVTGLYYYPNDVFNVIKTLKPSARGELEITDVNNYYVKTGRLSFIRLSGFWSDAGNPQSLYKTIEWFNSKLNNRSSL